MCTKSIPTITAAYHGRIPRAAHDGIVRQPHVVCKRETAPPSSPPFLTLPLSLFFFYHRDVHSRTHARGRETSSLRARHDTRNRRNPPKSFNLSSWSSSSSSSSSSLPSSPRLLPIAKPSPCHPSIHPAVDCRIISRSRVKQARASQSWIDGWKTRGWRSRARQREGVAEKDGAGGEGGLFFRQGRVRGGLLGVHHTRGIYAGIKGGERGWRQGV